MKNSKRFILLVLFLVTCLTLASCKKGDKPYEVGDDGMAKLTYPDLPHTGNEKIVGNTSKMKILQLNGISIHQHGMHQVELML